MGESMEILYTTCSLLIRANQCMPSPQANHMQSHMVRTCVHMYMVNENHFSSSTALKTKQKYNHTLHKPIATGFGDTF